MFKSKNYLKHGDVEFNRMQELIKKDVLDLFLNMTQQFGIIRNQIVGWDKWQVTQLTNNSVRIKSGNAIILDANNKPVAVSLTSDYDVTIPPFDTIYKVAFKHKLHNYEKGSISITNGNTTVTGNGTEFTKVLGENRSIIVNGKVLKVAAVIDDVTATLVIPYVGTTITSTPYSVGGYFINTMNNLDDNYIYEYNGIEIIIKTGDLVAGEYLLAEVTVVNGIISSIVDRRDLITLKMGLYAPSKIEIPHTFTITNEVKVPSGDLYIIVPFAVSKPAGQTISIKKCIYKILSGTSATVKVQKNGVDILTGLNVTTTKTTTIPTSDIFLEDGDEISLVVTAVNGTPKNLYFTISLEYAV
jgi:hypothetical protein